VGEEGKKIICLLYLKVNTYVKDNRGGGKKGTGGIQLRAGKITWRIPYVWDLEEKGRKKEHRLVRRRMAGSWSTKKKGEKGEKKTVPS